MADDTKGISSETLDYLSEVKKGKLRRFVMIAKGSSMVSLLVYKKGSLEKLKKEAKDAGKGQFYFGVVEGSGQAITFKLSAEDGFTSAPVKNSVLKGFLSDGGYTCKPEFQIVPKLPAVPDEDEAQPAGANASSSSSAAPLSSPAATVQPQTKAAEPPSREPEAAQNAGEEDKTASHKRMINVLLEKLLPAVKKALEMEPGRKDELLRPMASARLLLQANQVTADQFNDARNKLVAVGQLVKQIVSAAARARPAGEPTSASEAAAPQAAAAVETDEAVSDLWTQQLKEWRALRGQVIDNLKILAKDVAATKSPQAAAAVGEVKLVISKLVETPDSQAIEEMINFLKTSGIVKDICRMAFDFRKPVLSQLNALASVQAA